MRRVILIAAALQLLPTALLGQGNDRSEEARRRNECRFAAQVILHGQPANERESAMRQLSACPEEGPLAAVELWRNAPSDTAGVAAVRWATHELRDQRLVDVLFEVAGDAGRARVTRKVAMLQLISYAEPADATLLAHLEPSTRHAWVAASLSHPVRHVEGAVPIQASYRDEALSFFRLLAETDSDPSVRYAAGVLARKLDGV